MRNMSFMLTPGQILDQSKTVTRRIGWWFLEPGDTVQPVKKCQGLKAGEKVEKLGPPIRIVSVSKERLMDITQSECEKEGFPLDDPDYFVTMFCNHNDCTPSTYVNRIEFEYCNEAN